MVNANIQSLLEQWAALEPEECCKSTITPNCWHVGESGSLELDDLDDAVMGRLWIAITQILESRGWHYKMHWHGTLKIAYVYPPGITELIYACADNMVESLINAYFQALTITTPAINMMNKILEIDAGDYSRKWWRIHFKLESFYEQLPTQMIQDTLSDLLEETEWFAKYYEELAKEQIIDRVVDRMMVDFPLSHYYGTR